MSHIYFLYPATANDERSIILPSVIIKKTHRFIILIDSDSFFLISIVLSDLFSVSIIEQKNQGLCYLSLFFVFKSII